MENKGRERSQGDIYLFSLLKSTQRRLIRDNFDPLHHRLMYDLCTRPEQPPEPELEQPVSAADTDMEGRRCGEAEAPGQQNLIQQDRDTKTEEHGNNTTTTNGDSMDKTNLDTTSTTVTAPVTPKRHNSLYKDLNDCEVGGFRKVSPGIKDVVDTGPVGHWTCRTP